MSESRESRFKARAQREVRKARSLAEENAALIAHIEELEARATDTTELEQEVELLAGHVRESMHRAAWDVLARKANVDPDRLDDLWKLDPPPFDENEPDSKALAKHLAKALENRPFLIMPDGDEQDGDEDGGEPETDANGNLRPPSALDLKPRETPAPAGKGKGDDESTPPNKGKLSAAADDGKPAAGGKLGRGPGAGRGSRDNPRDKGPSIAETVDAEFSASGRTDPFRI